MKTYSLFLVAAALFILTGCGKDDKPSNNTKADFSLTGYEMPVPTTVTFLNTSANATSYSWDFGDNSTSTLSNPTHTYTLAGTYQLRLTATGPNGTSNVCKLVTVDALTNPSKSAFSYFFDRCSGSPVGAAFKTLNPASTNTVWDFGNGVINVNRDPIVQFLFPGDYTIKYSTQINGVRDTVTRVIQIQ